MKVIVAENSGVCFGVRRALCMLEDSVKRSMEENREVVMLGPLIHNPRVVEQYSQKGVKVKDIESVPENSVVVVRSHGITENSEIMLTKVNGITVVDTTCPYVKRIHQLVEKKSIDGFSVLIMGDKDHSEVLGITSRVKSEFIVVSPVEIVEDWARIEDFIQSHRKIYAVAQTTSRPSNYQNLLKKIRKTIGQQKGFVFESANTICTATFRRQDSAIELASRVEAMVVIGGMNSSNTSKLFQVVNERNKLSFWIESVHDLSNDDLEVLRQCKTIGLTAGASTPDDQIEEMKIFLGSLS